MSFHSFSLKQLDRKKQKMFRGAHPVRYQADVVSLASTKVSKSNSVARNGNIATTLNLPKYNN